MTIVAIHQPGYLPWLGFFKKMHEADIFVYFDDVKFVKKNFYNRNSIKTSNGMALLTVPVLSNDESLINNVKIDNTQHWQSKHGKSILFGYSQSKFFNKFKVFFEKLYEQKFDLLIDLNVEIIEFIKKQFDINTKIILSSELNISGNAPDKILDICKTLNATDYISGTVWAKDHLNIQNFKENNISLKFKEFRYPSYSQLYGKFLPNMSAIDLLFNEGKNKSIEILTKSEFTDVEYS